MDSSFSQTGRVSPKLKEISPKSEQNHLKTAKKSNISTELLQRFKDLEKRTEEVTRKSREKRLRDLQKSVKEKVDKEITLPEDRDILRKYDVKFGPALDNRKCSIKDSQHTENSDSKNAEQDWSSVNKYLGINDHLKGIDRGKAALKTGLEKKIDEAIKHGDFNTAEKLSDNLATREFGKKIADAFVAKDFMEKKELEECSKKKKQKLQWGFEKKHRWETKSNM